MGVTGTWACQGETLLINRDESWRLFARQLPDRLRNHFHKSDSLNWGVVWESEDRIRIIWGAPITRGREATWIRQRPAGPGLSSNDGFSKARPAGMYD